MPGYSKSSGSRKMQNAKRGVTKLVLKRVWNFLAVSRGSRAIYAPLLTRVSLIDISHEKKKPIRAIFT